MFRLLTIFPDLVTFWTKQI